MVVVAPDYAGLGVQFFPNGTEIHHEWLASPAGANDLAYALEAARSAFPANLPSDGPFVALGHSQGAGVSWSFAVRQAETPMPGYKGTVSIAPPVDFIGNYAKAYADIEANTLRNWTLALLGFQRFSIAGITAAYPTFNFSGMTPEVRARWAVEARLQGGLPTDAEYFKDIPSNETAVPGWYNSTIAQEFRVRTKFTGKVIKGPMLVISGSTDLATHPEIIEPGLDETCEALEAAVSAETLEYMKFSSANHFPILTASESTWLPWVVKRLTECGRSAAVSVRKKATGGCTRSSVEGFRTEHTVNGFYPNWLVTQGTKDYQYALG